MSRILLVLCTCPDRDSALAIATPLVEEGLAACVNIGEPLTSIYLWQGRLEQSRECLLLAKTTVERYRELESTIRERHPYELPEIIAVPVETGLADYLQWVEQCTTPPG
jgi:periplasmic divalent cation tolerance protein